MSDLIVLNIICLQVQKQLATLNNIQVLLKGGLIGSAHNLLSPGHRYSDQTAGLHKFGY